MRTMYNADGSGINVVEHIMVKNMWEYYVSEDTGNDNVRFCLVLGYETEMGNVDLREIEPYIILRTSNLSEVLPAPGWSWERQSQSQEVGDTDPVSAEEAEAMIAEYKDERGW